MKKTYAMIALCGATLGAVVPAASGQVLNEDLKLTASDAAALDYFGTVAISGTTAIVGAFGDDDPGSSFGSAYIFDTQTGQQRLKFTAFDAPTIYALSGRVAISGTTAIVGAKYDPGSDSSRAAYVFDTSSGQQLLKLTATEIATSDSFGFSVAISGTTALVGAYGGNNFAGSAYIFDIASGRQLFKLTASDSAEGERFGWSVAISGTTALVGKHFDDHAGSQSGSAYIFDTTTGQQIFKLTASDAARSDVFGISVAISGSTAIIGAWGDEDGAGSAYVFDTTTGQQLFKLTASDGAEGDFFGWSVAISGTMAIVGARSDDDTGSAYVFDTTTGQELFKLVASDAAASDGFGGSVGIFGTTAIVGARLNDDAGLASGSAYVFDLAAPPACPGDIADDFGSIGPDGMVGFGDFLALLGLVGPCPGGTPGCTGDIADDFGTLGADGMVSFGDFLALLGLVGPCP